MVTAMLSEAELEHVREVTAAQRAAQGLPRHLEDASVQSRILSALGLSVPKQQAQR